MKNEPQVSNQYFTLFAVIEARKKKGELHQLRLETKSMKKVNAMSSRTKDNLKASRIF